MNHEDNVQPPHWDVSSVYPSLSSPEFLGDKDLLENTLESLNAYLDEKHISYRDKYRPHCQAFDR